MMTNEERAALVERVGGARVTYTRGDGVVEIKRHHFDKLLDQIEADGKRIAELEAPSGKGKQILTAAEMAARYEPVVELYAAFKRVEELEAVVADLLTRFDPWSPHDHIAVDRARKALREAE